MKKDQFNQIYIGQTGRILKFRIAENRGYILNQVTSTATGAHLNLPGQSLANMKFNVLEQVRYKSETYRREQKINHINKFNNLLQGPEQRKMIEGEALVLYSLCASLFNKHNNHSQVAR